MLVVKLEVWPGGAVTRAKEIGRVFINNLNEDDQVGNYQVRADSDSVPYLNIPAISQEFIVENHDRDEAVFVLLGKVFAHFLDQQKTELK